MCVCEVVCVSLWNHAYLLDYSAISKELMELSAERRHHWSPQSKKGRRRQRCEPNQLLPHNADSDAGRDAGVVAAHDPREDECTYSLYVCLCVCVCRIGALTMLRIAHVR